MKISSRNIPMISHKISWRLPIPNAYALCATSRHRCKNPKIKQSQTKSERGFDPGHKDKEYESQDYDSKKSRKQAKRNDKEVKDKQHDTIR